MSAQDKYSELLAEAKDRVDILSNNLPTEIDPIGISPDSKIPYKVIHFREAMLWRTEELARGACYHYSEKDVVSALTLTRAAIEGMAATWYLYTEIKKVVASKSLSNFDKKVMALLMGGRDDMTKIKAINVLNFIDSVDKQISGFRKNYEILSEFSHPNWAGTTSLYSQIDRERVWVEFGKNIRGFKTNSCIGLSALISALIIYEHSYKQIADILTDFIKVCEEDLNI